MAEFCLDCYNRYNGSHYTQKQVVLDPPERGERCEGCGAERAIVLRVKGAKLHALIERLRRK